jgi:tetratricopeptide (TPR) repeat protein
MPYLLRSLCALAFLILTTPIIAAAQPGDRRPPEQIRRDLETRLNQTIEEIREHPDQYYGYVSRGRVYAELSARSQDELEKESFFQKALADFNKAIELEPNHDATYVDRAWLRHANFLASFDDIRADYLKAIRLVEKYEAECRRSKQSYDETRLFNLYNNLSALYLNRAEALGSRRELISELNLNLNEYSPWDDFDKAIAYAQKSVRVPYHQWNVVNAVLRKGDTAYKTKEYAIALATFQSDEQYLGKDHALFCENESNREFCASNQRDALLTFSLRRGRTYLKLHQPEEALTQLNVYIEKAYHLECADIFRLRAQAYYQLGDDERALAEEERAKKRGTAACPFDMQRW